MAGKSSQTSETISEINVVPLVDIVLVVLIIFMVTAPALIKPSMPVNLPESSSGDETTPSLLNIAITADGAILLNDSEMNENEIREASKIEYERNPEVQAIIVADQDIQYGRVVQVMDWIKSAGVKSFAVTTDRPMDQSSQ